MGKFSLVKETAGRGQVKYLFWENYAPLAHSPNRYRCLNAASARGAGLAYGFSSMIPVVIGCFSILEKCQGFRYLLFASYSFL